MASRVASWHHGSRVSVITTPMRRRRSSSARSVILANRALDSADTGGLRARAGGGAGLGLAQDLPVHLPCRRLGQVGHESHVAGVLVLAQPAPRELLQL